jgi:hypothetical protein
MEPREEKVKLPSVASLTDDSAIAANQSVSGDDE